MRNTKVGMIMTKSLTFISPNETLGYAAEKMKDIDCGFLPVGTKDAVIGTLTDRDIVIRAVSKGLNPAHENVEDFMTRTVYSCDQDDFLEDAADKMRIHNVSRLLVRDAQGHMVGVLTFGHILRRNDDAGEIAAVVKHATRKSAA
jgi:CBS domain-containing protein